MHVAAVTKPLPLDRRDLLALSLLLVFWVLFFAATKGSFALTAVDDAYIFLRVVENIVTGHGWVYNLSSNVNPLTSPLYTLVLLGLRLTGLEGPALIAVAYGLGLLTLGFLQYFGFRPWGRVVSLAIASATSTSAVLIKSWGMETSIFLACIAGTALAYQVRRPILTGVLAGFTALARPEGIALIAILGLMSLWRERRIPWTMAGSWLITILPWLVFSLAAFGSILPNTVAIKAAQSSIGDWALEPTWIVYFLIKQPGFPYLTLPLALVGLRSLYRQLLQGNRYPFVLVSFGLFQAAGYAVLHPPNYIWYFAPGNLAINVSALAGLLSLLPALREKLRLDRFRIKRPAARAVAIWCGVVVFLHGFGAAPVRLMKQYRLAEEYRQAATWIAAHTPTDVRVAATEIGYIGYYSHREMRDIHGLIHREALPHLKRQQWDWWFVEDPPEIIVTHAHPAIGEPDPAVWPEASYRAFRAQYHRLYANDRVIVYGRKI